MAELVAIMGRHHEAVRVGSLRIAAAVELLEHFSIANDCCIAARRELPRMLHVDVTGFVVEISLHASDFRHQFFDTTAPCHFLSLRRGRLQQVWAWTRSTAELTNA